MQVRYRDLLHEWQQANFNASAEDWDSFWRGFEAALAQAGISAQREAITYWEGSDDGLTRQFHLDTLRACGFADVAIHWQDLGEALVGARKGQQIKRI
jgi:hypothetical protein